MDNAKLTLDLVDMAELQSGNPPSSHVSVDFDGTEPPNDSQGWHNKEQHNLSFIQSNQQSEDLQGSIESSGAPAATVSTDIPGHTHNIRHRQGRAADFLTKRGFGWLMDEEVDEDDQKPLLEELDIDVKDIYYKLRCVLLPLPYFKVDRDIVRDSPDFWGPLAVILLYSLVSLYGQFRVVSWIMTIWLLGSALIFLLARVLGGEVNYSQCLGVIGYSTLPLFLTALILPFTHTVPYIHAFLKFLGVIWSTYSAGSLLCVQELRQKRVLLLYPLFLLFIYFFSLYTGA